METPIPIIPECNSTSTTTVPKASIPHVFLLLLQSAKPEEGFEIGVLTIQ